MVKNKYFLDDWAFNPQAAPVEQDEDEKQKEVNLKK